MLAIAAIAATAIGAGSLNNTILLDLQDFGVGSADIESPISAASIDYTIEAVPFEGQLKNVITACSFHSDEAILDDFRIICKLTNIDGQVIAEGDFEGITYEPSSQVSIPIDVFAFPFAHDVRNGRDSSASSPGRLPRELRRQASTRRYACSSKPYVTP